MDIDTMHVYRSMPFSTRVDLCNHLHNQDIELFHHYKDLSFYPIVVTPTPPLPSMASDEKSVVI